MTPRRGRPLRRRPEDKSPKSTVLVCSEGEVTERLYVNGLKRLLRGHPVHIDLGSASGEPLKIVKSAIKQVRARGVGAYDEVWCLVDVESPPQKGLPSALDLAREHGIHVATSNPCFELWLVLHLTRCDRHMTTKEMIRFAESKLTSYSGKAFRFEEVESFIGNAIARAEGMEKRYDLAEVLSNKNPSTSMWEFMRMLQRRGTVAFATSPDLAAPGRS
jgi:hypothetical protein